MPDIVECDRVYVEGIIAGKFPGQMIGRLPVDDDEAHDRFFRGDCAKEVMLAYVRRLEILEHRARMKGGR